MTALILLLTTMASVSQTPGTIWIEGESAIEHTMERHDWYDSVTKDSLSGGEWLSHFAEGDPPEALYQFDVPTAGEYAFWLRANSVARPRLSYQLDHGDWHEVDLGEAVENLNIATDSKPDMRFISWINSGRVMLAQGAHTIRFRFHSDNQNHGALDCFVFTQAPFMPRGALKPGEKSGRANPGYFAWEPSIDLFTSDALVDLGFLNEEIAGQEGYVQAQGNDFVLANGQKVKFWGANAGPGIYGLDHASHVYLAKQLAKRGVNLVRLHGGLYGRTDPRMNTQRLDDLHHLVWALKQEGIYTTLSFYFPLWFSLDEGQRPFMLLYFDEQMQAIYFRWADQLLNTTNPYTGIPLGKDTAVAMVEVVNEDSHFFWTFRQANMPAERWQQFTKLYGDWLKAKHGSLEAAIEAWGGVRESGDDPSTGHMQIYDAWMMTTDGVRSNEAKRKRIGEQVQFLTENMHGFYAQTAQFFRDECGYEGLVSASNWHTADARTLDALERYCYTAGDVIDRHGYYGSGHEGEGASWSVRTGHTFESASALTLEHNSPLPYVETEGYPHIISEIGWPMPNLYRAEGAFLPAAYGTLQGLDGIIHFAIGSASWDQKVGKFPLNTPVALGNYFATALMYRRGDVQEAPTVVRENLRLDELYTMEGSNVYVAPAFDQLRAADIPEGQEVQGRIEGIDPMSFYVGRVSRDFGGSPDESTVTDLSPHIDREQKRIRSITQELEWDYGVGIATVNTPAAQGAVGFLGKQGQIELDEITIDMRNDYGMILVISLDDRPIADSNKLLIQCMTVEQMAGWETSEPDGASGTIKSTGSAPWGIERFDASVHLRLDAGSSVRVTACDENGYATDKVVERTGLPQNLAIHIEPTTAYTVIER